MYIGLFAAVLLILIYRLIKKINSRKSEYSDFEMTNRDVDEWEADKNKPHRSNFLRVLAFSSIFWINGLVLLYSGLGLITKAKEITDQGNKTTALITNVYEYVVADPDAEYHDERDIYVTYTANGKKYDGIIRKAKIYDYAGEEIEIYYDSEDPTVIVSSENVDNKLSFAIPAGVVMCAIALAIHIIGRISKKSN